MKNQRLEIVLTETVQCDITSKYLVEVGESVANIYKKRLEDNRENICEEFDLLLEEEGITYLGVEYSVDKVVEEFNEFTELYEINIR